MEEESGEDLSGDDLPLLGDAVSIPTTSPLVL